MKFGDFCEEWVVPAALTFAIVAATVTLDKIGKRDREKTIQSIHVVCDKSVLRDIDVVGDGLQRARVIDALRTGQCVLTR